jgi:ribosome biogenesis GTPase
LEMRRWESYLKLQRELAALNRRHDVAARRAYQREWHQKVVVAGKSQRAAERYGQDAAGDRAGAEGKRGKRKRR